MGRKPTKNLNLPPRMRARKQRSGTVYYYYDQGGIPRHEEPLGKNFIEAVRKWAELEKTETPAAGKITFRHAAERYFREIVPTKSEATQRDNFRELKNLYKFFDNPPALLDDIEPFHIDQYLTWRGQTAKTRANREKALFSHIWNHARKWRYTSITNPCQGIKGHKENPRDTYVDDAEYKAVWEASDDLLRLALDLALLIGQRPADVLKINTTDIRGGMLWIKQNKTKARLRIVIEGALQIVLDRALARKQTLPNRNSQLLAYEDGTRFTYRQLIYRFEKARALSGQTWQFRDLRAKAGTDADAMGGIKAANALLGHTTEQQTADYIRHRTGKLVKLTQPT
ncbi:tyrosine-type recombinase/integrase [Chitinimonas sp. PSY-7]|uniref:tyrosine-type recombinase/integrase n=1 Tax=Chitinimonas sp. PSY-7 TaxID=3459088 RepID=UPI00403FFC6C